jgi:DNA-binding MarR family transcriptional regulator
LADEVWRAIAAAVIDNRDSWKRAVIEQTGLPFSRIRILRRLARKPMTVKQVAHAATIDAPAAALMINDLEDRRLVVRGSDQSTVQGRLIDRRRRQMVRSTWSTIRRPMPRAALTMQLTELKATSTSRAEIAFPSSADFAAHLSRREITWWRCRAIRAAPTAA